LKLLRDHNITHALLTKTEVTVFMKLINRRLVCRYDEDALDYYGFVHFLVQIALFFHLKARFISPQETGNKSMHSLTFGEMVENMITWFKLAADQRGFDSALYDCPEAAADLSKASKLKNVN
jgi:hypothetical protein